jgi:hypothetical protein
MKEITSMVSKGIKLIEGMDKPPDMHQHTLWLQASPEDLYIDIPDECLSALYDILHQYFGMDKGSKDEVSSTVL